VCFLRSRVNLACPFTQAVQTVRAKYGLDYLVMVGDLA